MKINTRVKTSKFIQKSLFFTITSTSIDAIIWWGRYKSRCWATGINSILNGFLPVRTMLSKKTHGIGVSYPIQRASNILLIIFSCSMYNIGKKSIPRNKNKHVVFHFISHYSFWGFVFHITFKKYILSLQGFQLGTQSWQFGSTIWA